MKNKNEYFDEEKYCKFCGKTKPIKEFVKAGFTRKNICYDCTRLKQNQIYKDHKQVDVLKLENEKLKKQLEEIRFDIIQGTPYIKLDTVIAKQKEFIKYIEDEIKSRREVKDTISIIKLEELLKEYKKIMGVSDEKNN